MALITAILWAGTVIVFTEGTKIVSSYVVNITRLLLATFFLIATILLLNLNYFNTPRNAVGYFSAFTISTKSITIRKLCNQFHTN